MKYLIVDESKEKHEHSLPKETEVAKLSTAVKMCEDHGYYELAVIKGIFVMYNEDHSKWLTIQPVDK